MTTWTAADGAVVAIRPITADDIALEREFVDGLSQRTGYLRLFSARRLSAEEIRQFTDIDPQREAALIATHEGEGGTRQVGVARFVMQQGGEAEFAMVLADAWQGRGLGAELLARLVDLARERGLARLAGVTLSENRPMLRLARRLGFRAAKVPGDATVTRVSLDLGPR